MTKPSRAEPEVRIQLPPAASHQRTRASAILLPLRPQIDELVTLVELVDRCGYDALWVGDRIAFAVPILDPLQQLAQACFDGSIVALDGTGEQNANNLGIRLGRRQIRSADA